MSIRHNTRLLQLKIEGSLSGFMNLCGFQFYGFSREIKVVKSLVQNRRVFTNFMCFLNSNFQLVFQPFNSTRFWPSKSILDLKSCDFHLTLKMMSVSSRRSRWLITIFYMISECFELLDRSVVIFGDTLCFRTTVLDEQPSHIQCLSIPSSQRALKIIVMTL